VKPAVYVPYTMWLETYTHLLVHTHGPPLSALHTVRIQAHAVDSDQQVEGQVFTLEELIDGQQEWQQAHLVTMLLGAFAFMALVLAVVGLYSVVSYGVAQRTREFGIRMALGAQRSDMLGLVFSSTTLSVGSGLAAGVLLSLTCTKLLARWVEGTAGNPLILLGATLLLVCSSALACFLPALRASSIDPVEALR